MARAFTAPEPSSANASAPAPGGRSGVRFVAAPTSGDVAPIVARARTEAAAEHRRLVVFVGAEWCPPCEAFHDAVDAHLLDAALPDLTLLEFDHDLDGDRLRNAGYACHSLPCFTAPGPDGRASSARAEGVASIDRITRQLRRMLDAPARTAVIH